MKREELIAELERRARTRGIEIRKGKYQGKSGMGKWKGQWVLLIDRGLGAAERIALLEEALTRVESPGGEPPEAV